MSDDDTQLLDSYEPPAWLRKALDASRAAPDFLARSEAAASIALSLARMRRERSRSEHFVDLPLASYLSGIAQLAEADLPAVLRSLNVPDLSRLDSTTVGGAVRLCKAIGMTFRETIAHVRIGFAEAQGFGPFNLIVALRGLGGRGLDSCEAALAQTETDYPISTLHQIRSLESAIHSAYRELE